MKKLKNAPPPPTLFISLKCDDFKHARSQTIMKGGVRLAKRQRRESVRGVRGHVMTKSSLKIEQV